MEKSSTDIVFDAICDLHNQEQVVTRETLSQICSLPMSKIDDRISTLIDNDMVIRVQRGVYVPTIRHPPARLMSKTVLPDGTVKIDIGDDVLTLTPKEARTLGSMMVAEAMQYSNIETGHNMNVIQNGLMDQVRLLVSSVEFLNINGLQKRDKPKPQRIKPKSIDENKLTSQQLSLDAAV